MTDPPNSPQASGAGDDALRRALSACETRFLEYADLHLAKDPPDREKALRNIEMALMCQRVLTETTAPDPPPLERAAKGLIDAAPDDPIGGYSMVPARCVIDLRRAPSAHGGEGR